MCWRVVVRVSGCVCVSGVVESKVLILWSIAVKRRRLVGWTRIMNAGMEKGDFVAGFVDGFVDGYEEGRMIQIRFIRSIASLVIFRGGRSISSGEEGKVGDVVGSKYLDTHSYISINSSIRRSLPPSLPPPPPQTITKTKAKTQHFSLT